MPEICPPETEARRPNLRRYGRLSPTGKNQARDRTAWLGREDSNLRMAESKSAALPLGYAPILPLPVAAARGLTIMAGAMGRNSW